MIIKKTITALFYVFILYTLLLNPQLIIISVKNALKLCYENVIPSLFIFMLFSSYISQSSSSQVFSILFIPYSKIMKCSDRKYPTFLFLSLIGGFATGATLINTMKKSGYDEKFIRLAAVSMIGNSMAFCVYSVGVNILNSINIGVLIYISLVLSQLISAYLLSFFYEYSEQKIDFDKRNKTDIVKSINITVTAILSICGFVVVFYCICEVISLYIKNTIILSIIYSFLEVTNSCIKVVSIYGKNPFLLCTVLSILPISTCLQIYNFTEDLEIIKTLLFSRILVVPISVLILSILINLFPYSVLTSNVSSVRIKSCQAGADISIVMFLITLSFISILDGNKLFTKSNV